MKCSLGIGWDCQFKALEESKEKFLIRLNQNIRNAAKNVYVHISVTTGAIKRNDIIQLR